MKMTWQGSWKSAVLNCSCCRCCSLYHFPGFPCSWTSHAGSWSPCSRAWMLSAKHRLLRSCTSLHAMRSSFSGCHCSWRRALQLCSQPLHSLHVHVHMLRGVGLKGSW